MYLILCWSYLNHSLRFVGEKKRMKKKSHIESQSQYFGKKSQLDYFPKSFSPTACLHASCSGNFNTFYTRITPQYCRKTKTCQHLNVHCTDNHQAEVAFKKVCKQLSVVVVVLSEIQS